MARIATLAACLLAFAAVGGCATPPRGDVYSRAETRQAWDVHYGEVTGIDQVTIEGQRTPLGRVGGGLVGYEVGRAIGGSGSTSRIVGALGGVAGAVAGQAVEESATRQPGLQITVRLDSGRTIAVVQAADQPFVIGEQVRVYTRRDGAARVAKR